MIVSLFFFYLFLNDGSSCRWDCSLLGSNLLQQWAFACWWQETGLSDNRDTSGQGLKLIHIKRRVGLPSKNIFQWWELWNASSRHLPYAAKRFLNSEAYSSPVLPSPTLFNCQSSSYLALTNKFCTPYILKLLLDVHDSTENGVWIALFLPNTLRTECIYANPASHEAELWILSIAFLSKFGRKKKKKKNFPFSFS